MLNCESCELLIADALYGDLNKQQSLQLERHLEQCRGCRQLADDLQGGKIFLEGQGLAGGNFSDIPERARLDNLWENIEPSLDSIDAERYCQQPRLRPTPLVATAMAMAASVIIFFAVLPAGDQSSETTNTVATGNAVAPELLSYLARVEALLMTVANAESNNTTMVPVQQTFARDMAVQANFMTNDLDDSFNSGQSRLLKDIEFMLLQIANLDESNMEEGVQLLQQYMEDNSVLLKIRLMEMRNQQDII